MLKNSRETVINMKIPKTFTVEIITSGSRVHSKYLHRKSFKIDVFGSPDYVVHLAHVFNCVYNALYDRIGSKDIDFSSYCFRCNELKLKGKICFRHQTLLECSSLIGFRSNHEYKYIFTYRRLDLEDGKEGEYVRFHFLVGAGRWEVRGVVGYIQSLDPTSYVVVRHPFGGIKVIRPSGIPFKYLIKGTSIAKLLKSIIDFLSFIMRSAYTTIQIHN